MDINTKISLNNGLKIPIIGLGTYQNNHTAEEVVTTILAALDAGYRHIDTAEMYGNEKNIGVALKKSSVPREELFITTKSMSHENVKEVCEQSLRALGIGYIDLLLIHWPYKNRIEMWGQMQELLNEGKCKAIGVSNFTIDQLRELIEKTGFVPAVNQVEFSPFLYQEELLNFCNEKGIVLEAYSPLTRGHKLNDPVLKGIARKYDKTPAQVLIRWSLQKGLVVLPKSKLKERIIENINVFDFNISEEDMQKLDSLNEDLHTCWNPSSEEQLKRFS